MVKLTCLIAVALNGARGRRFHDANYHRHAHTYLQFCANDTNVLSHACVHKVSAKWPSPAQLDPQECKEAAPPFSDVGTSYPGCAAGSLSNVNIYDPITIPTGLRNPASLGGYRHGADVDTMTDWDRVRCRDGQLFATGWYKKYTPQECARLCAKISNFYGKTCTHFTRQWITTRIAEHSDVCGRDGETLDANMPVHGAWGSAGTGAGTYTYRGQCLFFNSPNDHCCSTKAAWREDGGDTDSNYCTSKYGARHDSWDTKHRSWRLLPGGAFTPTAAWPVVSAGRRLDESRLNGSDSLVHELFHPNGTRFWAVEDLVDDTYGIKVNDPEDEAGQRRLEEDEVGTILGAGRRLLDMAFAAWQQLWR